MLTLCIVHGKFGVTPVKNVICYKMIIYINETKPVKT